MPTQKLIYQNKNYNIQEIEENIGHSLPTLLHTAYYDGMVVMPKCKCFITLTNIDIYKMGQIIETSRHLAFIRKEYQSTQVKRGCFAQILDYTLNEEENNIKLHIEGISRFISYQDASIVGYPHELVKPDYEQYHKDNTSTPIPINLDTLDPILVRFFVQFISTLDIGNNINFASLSMDKLLNSLIMVMPITDSDRLYLSELPSLSKRERALSLILNCTFNNLTSSHQYH